MFRPACEVAFEVLQEDDRTHSGEGGCQGVHAPSSEFPTWAKGTTVHPVIQAGTLGMVLRSSPLHLHLTKEPPHRGRLYSFGPLAKERSHRALVIRRLQGAREVWWSLSPSFSSRINVDKGLTH